MRKVSVVMVAVLLALLGGACGGDDDGDTTTDATGTGTGSVSGTHAAEEPSRVTVKTTDYRFDTPGTFKGGLVNLELDNTAGKESHEADMIRVDPGKTANDVVQAMRQEGPPPPWAHAAGGPGPVLPGKKATYTANLAAGTYVLLCHVPSPDGKNHIEKGMVSQVTVTEGKEGTLPQGDVTVGANEFDFTGLDGLKAGNQTVRVENQGQQEHHWAVVALAPGKTPQDVAAFFQATQTGGPPQGPPPITGFPGLVSTLPPGGVALRTLELQSGTTYMFVCFVPDKDGVPHAAKGMAKPITIK